MSELTAFIHSALKVRRKLVRTGHSRANLGDLLAKVEYWVAASTDIEKTALKRRKEITVVLPPNYVKRFNEIMGKIEE